MDLLETIQSNTEDWDNDKGKESGINYEYDCIKSFTETADFKELYGLFKVAGLSRESVMKKLF